MFIYGETSSSKMHVAGLLPFTPPADAPRDYLRQMVDDARRQEVMPPWNRKLAYPRLQFSPLHTWVTDTEFDFDYHVRRSALASPGDERELGILVSRLHSNHLDLTRPPWELHVIEGLEGGRFALYMKIHHALVDGYTAMRMLGRSLSTDPQTRDARMFFNVPIPKRSRPAGAGAQPSNPVTATLRALGAVGSTVSDGVGSAVDLASALVNTQIRRDGDFGRISGSASAPHSILNARISRNRRFATQQYEFDRLKKLSSQHGATINDVALAIIGGGLRKFLADLDELPDRSLIAFLPVNVRPKGDEGGGNAVGAILAPMGTDIDDPVAAQVRQRREAVRDMARHHVHRVAHSGEIIGAVPFGEQAQEGQQSLLIHGGNGQRHCLEASGQQGVQLAVHAAPSPISVERTGQCVGYSRRISSRQAMSRSAASKPGATASLIRP